MQPSESEAHTIGSLQRSFRIIEGLNELGGAGITELSDHVGYPTSSVHEHLVTLQEENYVIKEDDVYRLSLNLLSLAEDVRRRRDRLNVRTHVDSLADELGMIVTYFVEESGEGVFLYRSVAEYDINTAKVGKRVPLHATAAGKTILAHLSEERVEDIIETQGLSEHTDKTITSKEELLDELETIREQGYALNRGERITRLLSIAVPVFDPDGQIEGALAVTCPRHQITDDEMIERCSNTLLAKSEEIELETAYSGSV